MLQTLREIGWEYASPTVLRGNRGNRIELAKGEPKRLQLKLYRTLEEQHEAGIMEAAKRDQT